MTGNNILSIKKVGDLFTDDLEVCKSEYKELAKKWHPDTNSEDTTIIFEKINSLYKKALQMIKDGVWEESNFIRIHTKSNKRLDISFLHSFIFELGVCYVCNKHIIYVIDSDKSKYSSRMKKATMYFTYANDKMKHEFKNYLPKIVSEYETTDNKHIIILDKSEDLYPLPVVLSYYNGRIPDKHVAWIISRLLNITCYMDYAGIVHNGIGLNECFISPENHKIALLGGWWYSTRKNAPMVGTTKDIYDVIPLSVKNDKKSNIKTDLESIKLIGRQALGEKNIGKFLRSDLAPSAFTEFLVSSSNQNAYEEMKKWEKALLASYGKRRFIRMEIPKEIYNV